MVKVCEYTQTSTITSWLKSKISLSFIIPRNRRGEPIQLALPDDSLRLPVNAALWPAGLTEWSEGHAHKEA